MEEEAVVFFDAFPVPEEIKSVVQIQYWGELIFKKHRLQDRTKNILKRFSAVKFFHIRTAKDLTTIIDHFSLTPYKNYFFFNSSVVITDEQLFLEFLEKIKYIHESLALYQNNRIKSFLRLNKEEILALLSLIKNEPDKLVNHLKIQFENKIEHFQNENFFIEIEGYLDFVHFLHNNFTPRYFNAVERKEDIIIKQSPDKKKMKMEYSYYHLLPEELRYFFIPTFSFKETEHYAQYSTERFSIPDLAIQWIHLSIDEIQFEKLLLRLFGFIQARKPRKLERDKLVQHADAVYLDKLNQRLKQLQEKPVYERLQKLFTSSTTYPSIESIFEKYREIYQRCRDHKAFAQQQVIGHGDFCFSNILYDKRIDLLKLIDPKGSLDLEDAYLDSYYDVAKLSHSILGNYDFINNGLYEVVYDQNLIATLDIKSIESQDRKKLLFKKALQKNGFDYQLVRVFELSLFLSMTPLHIDNEKNVFAFLLNACTIIDELESY